MLLLQLATTGVLAALAGPMVETQHFSGTPRLWLALLYLALFPTLLAFGVQTWAQRILPPVRVALILALEPVFAALTSFVFFQERGAEGGVLNPLKIPVAFIFVGDDFPHDGNGFVFAENNFASDG